ncbi:hypothetical protein [Microbacterium sp. NPDC087868]|uniref:hypothetical protein n=1 Tax=Microbacterium sp. NPDC087868 TaxID=3364195 RepID=UPI00385056E8
MSRRPDNLSHPVTDEKEAKLLALLDTPEARALQEDLVESILRSAARLIILRGDVDAATVTLDELRTLAWREFRTHWASGTFQVAPVVDHSSTILEDARRFAADGNLEYAFVFYGLHLEHLLNRSIRDGGVRRSLSEAETIEVMKRSIYDKTGTLWLLLFEERMPEELSRDIRAVANVRNQFAHYKWTPEQSFELSPDESESRAAAALETAERAALGLQRYADELILPAESEAFDWLSATSG